MNQYEQLTPEEQAALEREYDQHMRDFEKMEHNRALLAEAERLADLGWCMRPTDEDRFLLATGRMRRY